MFASLARRGPLAALALVIAGLLLIPSAPAQPASPAAPAAKVKPCKRKKGETKKRWLKRCKCTKFKRGETRAKFRKRCPGARVPRRPSTGGGQAPAATPVPAPAPAPILEPVRNDAGFAEVLGRSDFLRTYNPSASATHSEYYNFCRTRLEPHHYEGIAYIYESRGPWRVLEGYVNGDGSKGHGVIEFVQEQTNFDEERGKVQQIRFSWPEQGRSDIALIVHPEIGSYFFARSLNAAADC